MIYRGDVELEIVCLNRRPIVTLLPRAKAKRFAMRCKSTWHEDEGECDERQDRPKFPATGFGSSIPRSSFPTLVEVESAGRIRDAVFS